MGDTLITVIAIFLAAILMFVFPLMALSERTDDMAQLSVQTATTEFVDDVRTTGKLSLSDYEQFLQTITATGNAFDVELEIKHLDENPGQKTTQAEVTKIGENIYYNEYTSQIMDKLEDKGYIERIINKNNRRKYILTLTKEGEEVIPALKREADYWHNSVGLAEVSEETMDVIRTVARKSYNLVND